MRRTFFSALVLLTCATMGCSRAAPAPVPSGHLIGVATFRTSEGTARTSFLAVADTEAERERGLMERTSLARDGGEVFVFGGTVDATFWMKDTLIPLSIAFWDASGTIVDLSEMVPCTADPCPRYGSRAPYTHALEMNAGWFADHGVTIGDTVELRIGTE
jgi:uncharacterized membrane protein (UPF0127 family)